MLGTISQKVSSAVILRRLHIRAMTFKNFCGDWHVVDVFKMPSRSPSKISWLLKCCIKTDRGAAF